MNNETVEYFFQFEINDPPTINIRGNKFWKNSRGEYSRDNNLPAQIWKSGVIYFYKDGLQHREDNLPAVIHPSGYKEYWKNGKRHRSNGPARECISGNKNRNSYWFEGFRIRTLENVTKENVTKDEKKIINFPSSEVIDFVTLRKCLNLSQREMSLRGICCNAIVRIEKNKKTMSIQSFQKYVEALGGVLEFNVLIEGKKYKIDL